MKNLIIASTSTLHEGDYLEYLLPELTVHFQKASTILFIPYARPSGISHEDYTKKVSEAFTKINKKVKGIHEFENPEEAIKNAEGIFTGGEKKESYLERIDDLYPDQYYVETLEIDKDYIAGFKYFIVEDAAFIKNLDANNKKELEYTIIELSQEYKQLLGQ